MMKIEIFYFGLALVWGLALGLFYFGGLWWTLRIFTKKARPGFWFGLSFLIRSFVVMLFFWITVEKDIAAFFITFAGFFLMRFFLTHKLGVVQKGNGHAH
ncbi:MAG: ATP synthase subunit I [Deltaproteobacteria bacterium]|nr:ATP synthase subunit I [Deltaproteobacteria bacterium]